MSESQAAKRRRVSPSTAFGATASVLAVAAIAIALTRGGSNSSVAAAKTSPLPAPSTVTVTETAPASPPVTTTVTKTVVPKVAPPVAPIRTPQGTVDYGFQNASDIDTSCTDLTLFVHNRSDTAVISVTVSFKTDYSGYPHPNSEYKDVQVSEHTDPQTLAVGVPPYSDRSTSLKVCVTPPFHVDEPDRASTAAIPVSFTWKWPS